MVRLTVTKPDFDELVYPAVALVRAADVATLRLMLSVLCELEEAAEPVPPRPGEVRMYQLRSEEYTFEFEAHVAELVARALEDAVPMVAASRARAIPALLAQLRPEEV